MAVTETRPDPEQPTRSRPSASTILGGLAVVSVIGTLGLWAVGSAPWTKYVPEVGREVFGNIPFVLEAVFYVAVAAFLGIMFWLFALRARAWQRGGAERRTGMWRERVAELARGMRMQTLLEDRAAGLMHALVYYGFIVLFLGTVTLEIDHLLPQDLKFLEGGFYQGYSFVLDLASVAFLGGLVWAAVRRYVQRPWRLRSKTKAEDGWILVTLATIGVTGLLTEAARIAWMGTPDFERWSFVGYPMSFLFAEASAGAWHRVFWVAHAAAFVAFLVVLPTTKLRHMVTSPANMFLSPNDRPKAAMKPLPNLMETDQETFGASVVSELTWKQLFDTDACTVCGRCTSVCPANATGKALDPREIVMKVGEVSSATADTPVSTPVSLATGIDITTDSLFERITNDEIFACTTCRACDEICPVDIEIVDKILDMRRYKTLMESDFPTELGKAYMALENQGNPWGMAQSARADWAKDLPIDVPILGEDKATAEYLYWVGCAGSFDDRNVAVTKSVATLLDAAGVDYAILGPKEGCTGDPARRSGNEYLFQMAAFENIATLDGHGVTKIITQCPHCLTTLGKDYQQFGGDYEVIHHSQLLAELVRRGHLDVDLGGRTVTYHDPCYLGRGHDVYVDPREVVATSGRLIEMERSGPGSFCCGAGGARFFMEESTGKKVNIERSEEALATGADTVAVGCPFCFVMMDDGVKELGGDGVEVKDLAMLLAESLRTGESTTSEA
ncbi:MAG: (Fe-S)-binding protein [Acidimicrobiia bacterium]